MNRALILLSLCCLSYAKAQDFQRVAPQVTSTTITIDRDTNGKNLQEQALRVLKNTNHNNYQAVFLIIKSALRTVKEIGLDETKINVAFGRDQLRGVIELLAILDENVLYNALFSNLESEPFGQRAVTTAQEILDKWKSRHDSKLNKIIARRITALADLGLSVTSNEVLTRPLIDDLLENIPAIIGLDIDQASRLKSISELIFSLQHILEDIQFKSNENEVSLHIGTQEILRINSSDERTLQQCFILTLDGVKSIVRAELVDHLSVDDPAVAYFDIFFAKIRTRIEQLGEQRQLEMLIDVSIGMFVNDFLKMIARDDNSSRYLTDLGKTMIKMRKFDTEAYARDFFVNTISEIIGEFVGGDLNEALKNPARISWLNNFSGDDTSPEFNTTIAYKIINRPKWIWEISTNVFFNRTTTVGSENGLAKDLGKRVIIGSSIKFPSQNNDFELALNMGTSSVVLGTLSDLDASAPDVYSGLSLAKKFGSVIIRPFYEWEVQRDSKRNKLNNHNTGIDIRLPDSFILSGFFISHKFNFGTSIGVNFSVVK